MSLEEQVILLIAENKQLKEIISNLEKRIAELEEQLRRAKISKNSGNSSKPPSTDISRPGRNQSLREASGKNPGGQPGHKGTSLQMTDNPDEIVDLKADYCNKCGCSLEDVKSKLVSKRQVIDIPPVSPVVTEYRNYAKCCPKCGHHQQSSYPNGIRKSIQYGNNIEAAISYFSVYQYLPFKRMQECLKHFFNLGISQGSIDNILKRMALKANPVYTKIKETVSNSKQIGSDETSAKVKGKNWWVWVWQTSRTTFLSASESRGSKTIDTLFPNGFEHSVLNSDRWAAQLKTNAQGHQLCIAHLLRDLKYLQQLEKNKWAHRMEEVLRESLDLKEKQSEYIRNDQRALQLEEKLDVLLIEDIPKIPYTKTYALQKSLIKNRYSILTFLYNKETSPDNNASERAIRNVKVKQKVSGQFKSNENIFCILRSVIDTCLKRGVDVLYALNLISQFALTE